MHESDDIVKKCDDTKPVPETSQHLKPMNFENMQGCTSVFVVSELNSFSCLISLIDTCGYNIHLWLLYNTSL